MTQIALRLVDDGAHTPTPEPPTAIAPSPAELTDHELLARFLPDSERIIDAAGGFRAALTRPFEDLARHGVTHTQYEAMRTAIELGRRYVEAPVRRGEALTSPTRTRRALTAMLRDLEHEVFVAIFLTVKHEIIATEQMFRGSVDIVHVHVREIVKRALALNAGALIVSHCHPSGRAAPSEGDKALTKALHEALALVQVRLLDHFVIGDGESHSFAEHGWL